MAGRLTSFLGITPADWEDRFEDELLSLENTLQPWNHLISCLARRLQPDWQSMVPLLADHIYYSLPEVHKGHRSMAGARLSLSGRQQAIAEHSLSDHHAFTSPSNISRTAIPASNSSDLPYSATQPAVAVRATAPAILSLPSSSFSLQSQQHDPLPCAAATSSGSSISSEIITLQQQLHLLQSATLSPPLPPRHAVMLPAFRPRAKPTSSDDNWDISSASGCFSDGSSPLCFPQSIRASLQQSVSSLPSHPSSSSVRAPLSPDYYADMDSHEGGRAGRDGGAGSEGSGSEEEYASARVQVDDRSVAEGSDSTGSDSVYYAVGVYGNNEWKMDD